jgi:toxin YoeB
VKLVISPRSRTELAYFIKTNPRLALKIIDLMDDVGRGPFGGTGKPEPLKGDHAGLWSRRINDEHRLVYRVLGKAPDQILEIISCRFHYSDKKN